MKTAKCFRKMLSRLSREHYFFRKQRKGGKGEGAGGVPSLVKGHAVGYEARPRKIGFIFVNLIISFFYFFLFGNGFH